MGRNWEAMGSNPCRPFNILDQTLQSVSHFLNQAPKVISSSASEVGGRSSEEAKTHHSLIAIAVSQYIILKRQLSYSITNNKPSVAKKSPRK